MPNQTALCLHGCAQLVILMVKDRCKACFDHKVYVWVKRGLDLHWEPSLLLTHKEWLILSIIWIQYHIMLLWWKAPLWPKWEVACFGRWWIFPQDGRIHYTTSKESNCNISICVSSSSFETWYMAATSYGSWNRICSRVYCLLCNIFLHTCMFHVTVSQFYEPFKA